MSPDYIFKLRATMASMIEGEKCSSMYTGGILYTAATSNILGTLFDISRATGQEQERIRTERSINWLSDPEFVSSVFIKQDEDNNPTGDDNKIYFFFTEVAKEYDLYTTVKVPRVARVCKSDVGGMKTLQRRWTTFIKAQLVCEDRASGQRYNILTDVYTTQHTPSDPSSTHFYGLFTSQWYIWRDGRKDGERAKPSFALNRGQKRSRRDGKKGNSGIFRKLTQSDWTEECVVAFQKLKDALLNCHAASP
ncbi:semaphorin-4B-like [Salmo salar]|uniref:Semaphorin-4B-like n=1 Tax=Salmo salar TaxID=8030 RepID=A0A1S3SF27_SALSA|nr:semaphorin-4B-like [Salmo salar]|eukprot:XP_014062947.1 PREDICTED: semaphorin-4B-like [Salmo salar]